MTFQLQALPRDIITGHILQLLPPLDALNLVRALKLKITREVYAAVFGGDTCFDHYSQDMFEERARCSLYLIRKDGTTDYVPVGTILQVSAGADGILVLNEEGKIHNVDLYSNTMTVVTKLEGLSRVPDNFVEKNSNHEYQREYFEDQTESFRCVNFGPKRLAAVDQKGLLWTWLCNGDKRRVQVMRGFATSKGIVGGIDKVRVTEKFIACEMKGKGIFVCQQRMPHANGTRAGYPCFNGKLNEAAMIRIAGTREVQDFAAFKNILMYLRKTGEVRAVSINETFASEQSFFKLDKFNREGPFIHLSANSDGCFTLVSESGRITSSWLQRKGENSIPSVVCDSLRSMGVASVSNHGNEMLALTKGGDVYGWKMRRTPKRVYVPGKAYGVYAGYGYSAVLVYEKSSKRRRIR